MALDVVVGAAIVRAGRVLAARRTSPAEHAGGWEFPGGKVDPGEDPAQACVREVREELGCDVRPYDELPGRTSLGGRWELTVLLCELVGDAEPVPSEHDAIRWLGAGELYEVPWLAGDLPFVDALRSVLGPSPGEERTRDQGGNHQGDR